MNRRSFLTSASAATAGGLIATRLVGQNATPPKKVTYTPVDVALFHAAGTANSLATASLIRGNATPQDFKNAAAALTAMHTNWVAAGLDKLLIPGFNQVNESDMTVAKMGSQVTWCANNLKVYNPSITEPQVASYLGNMLNNSVIGGIDYKTVALNDMRAGRTSQMILDEVTHLNAVAGKVPAPSLNASTHQYKAQIYYPPTGGGGSGADPGGCGELDLASFALGLAAVVLTVMTDGLDLLAAAAWEGIAYWAGIGAAGVDITAHVVC